jgi:serine/threonine protein kinase
MLSAAQRFTYFTRTERRKSYCEYKGETYIKDKLAGIGRYGTSFEFISAKDPAHSVVVKRENMRMENDEETYNFGLELEDEARYAQYFLAFGAFAGDVDDTHEPHYVLMEKVPGKVIGAQLKLTTALELLNVFDAILIALRRINEHPVLPCAHGDVRRENIMLQQDAAGNYSAKLIDFGLTNELGVMTTPMLDEILPVHIAPEVKDGTVAHSRQDILGLGSVFCVFRSKRTAIPVCKRTLIAETCGQ